MPVPMIDVPRARLPHWCSNPGSAPTIHSARRCGHEGTAAFWDHCRDRRRSVPRARPHRTKCSSNKPSQHPANLPPPRPWHSGCWAPRCRRQTSHWCRRPFALFQSAAHRSHPFPNCIAPRSGHHYRYRPPTHQPRGPSSRPSLRHPHHFACLSHGCWLDTDTTSPVM